MHQAFQISHFIRAFVDQHIVQGQHLVWGFCAIPELYQCPVNGCIAPKPQEKCIGADPREGGKGCNQHPSQTRKPMQSRASSGKAP